MTIHIAEWDRGWTLMAYDRPADDASKQLLGTATRACIIGSRGTGWYWDIWVGGKQYDARRKPEARAELIRLAEEHLAAVTDNREEVKAND